MTAATATAERVRLLVVDDSPEDRATYRRMLSQGRHLSYDVQEAEAADDGLKLVSERRPDCILLDFRLPDLNGLEFLAELSRIAGTGDVAVVMLTGQGDEQVAAEAIKSGAQEYLSKVRLQPDSLHAAIQSALRLSQAQRELEIHRQQLERSNRDLERYARVVAHDLEAPLKGILKGLAHLQATSGDRIDSESAEFVRDAIERAGHMTVLIRDILEYSRARADTTPLEPVETAKAVSEAIANLRSQIEAAGATITTGDLPQVLGSESQLIQLFQNLLSNAIKYRSIEPPSIRVFAEALGDQWRFAVRDNGIGIDPRQADRIFEPFVRLQASSEVAGTGVGLATCRAVVERHGGRIWIDSAPGQGSTFYFTIQRAVTSA